MGMVDALMVEVHCDATSLLQLTRGQQGRTTWWQRHLKMHIAVSDRVRITNSEYVQERECVRAGSYKHGANTGPLQEARATHKNAPEL